jgi:hypothetical protein
MRVSTARDGGRGGLTLLELVLVIFLMALLVGVGIGAFAALDLGKKQAAGMVRGVLRSAQNTAIASAAPARVRIDKQAGTIRAESLITVASYAFEGRSVRGYGPDGTAEPEDFDERGFVGACFRPAGKLRSVAEIPLEADPGCDLTRGFALECALLREGEGGGRVLAIGPNEMTTLALDLGPNGALRARMRTRIGDAASERPGGEVVLQSEPGLVPAGRWMLVRMRYDRARFELLLDGSVVASEPEERFVWRMEGPLVLSNGALPFPGRIDNLVVAVMVEGDPGELPDSVRFAGDAPEEVRFAASGGLDREAHSEPPRIALDFQDGSRETVVVGLYGTVE